IRSISYSRYFRIPTPMATGRAAKPSVMTFHSDEVTASEGTPTTAKTTAPLSRWWPAVREEQDGNPEERDRGCPAGLGEHRGPAERETAVPQPVVGHHVEAGVLGERAEKPHEEEDPAERVAGLAPRHHQAHRTV